MAEVKLKEELVEVEAVAALGPELGLAHRWARDGAKARVGVDEKHEALLVARPGGRDPPGCKPPVAGAEMLLVRSGARGRMTNEEVEPPFCKAHRDEEPPRVGMMHLHVVEVDPKARVQPEFDATLPSKGRA